MPKKSPAKRKPRSRKQTPEEIAERRIKEWMRDRGKPNPRDKSDADLRDSFGASTRELNLHGLGLVAVPEKLREVSDVEILNLAGNKIRELPQWIKELSQLRAITLASGSLERLPPEIQSLPSLVCLYLYENPELGIPESIARSNNPEEILRYYFESRGKKGTPLLELKLLLVGRGGRARPLW